MEEIIKKLRLILEHYLGRKVCPKCKGERFTLKKCKLNNVKGLPKSLVITSKEEMCHWCCKNCKKVV